jgi:hypothetical protein
MLLLSMQGSVFCGPLAANKSHNYNVVFEDLWAFLLTILAGKISEFGIKKVFNFFYKTHFFIEPSILFITNILVYSRQVY